MSGNCHRASRAMSEKERARMASQNLFKAIDLMGGVRTPASLNTSCHLRPITAKVVDKSQPLRGRTKHTLWRKNTPAFAIRKFTSNPSSGQARIQISKPLNIEMYLLQPGEVWLSKEMGQRIPIDLVQIMKKINLDQESQLLYLGRSNLGEDHLHPDQRCPHMEARETVEFDSTKMKGPKVGVVPKINSVVHIVWTRIMEKMWSRQGEMCQRWTNIS